MQLTTVNKRQLITLSAATAAAAAGFWLYASSRQKTPTPVETLWALELPTPAGERLPLKSFKGKPLLINFWASWCAPCVEEMPLLEQLFRQQSGLPSSHQTSSLQMLGIAADKAASVVNFLAHTPVSFPIVIANYEGISISRTMGNTEGGLPFTVLIDKNKQILFQKKGRLTKEDSKTIVELII